MHLCPEICKYISSQWWVIVYHTLYYIENRWAVWFHSNDAASFINSCLNLMTKTTNTSITVTTQWKRVLTKHKDAVFTRFLVLHDYLNIQLGNIIWDSKWWQIKYIDLWIFALLRIKIEIKMQKSLALNRGITSFPLY